MTSRHLMHDPGLTDVPGIQRHEIAFIDDTQVNRQPRGGIIK